MTGLKPLRFSAIFALTGFFMSFASASFVVAQTQYGQIRGLQMQRPDYAFSRFQGVPFARPPLPPHRWQKPAAPGLWSDVLDCTNFTIGCAQNAHSLDVPWNKSEDCLYLELFVPPAGKFSEKASVMVFFHGGDWKEGGESFQVYDGGYMAGVLNQMVVVANYRLAAFGFFYPQAVGLDPNVGIADQRFALRWIQQNAAFFNADPSKVMVAGQSAGGESVLIHVTNPVSSQGLFSVAMAESGPLSMNFKYIPEARTLGRTFAIELGCDYLDFACFQSPNTTQVLRAMQRTLNVPLSWSDAIQMWAPVITGPNTDSDTAVVMQPVHAFQLGNVVKNITFVSGSNSGDGIMFSYAIAGSKNGVLKELPNYEYLAIVFGIFNTLTLNPGGLKVMEEIISRYPGNPFGDNKDALAQLITDYVFQCSARYALQQAAANGGLSVYSYVFSRVPPACPWPKGQSYCCNFSCHGDEMVYVFHDSGDPFPWTFPQADLDLAADVSAYWASFGHYGQPNAFDRSVNWSPWNNVTRLAVRLDLPEPTVLKNYNGALCDFWDKIGYDTENMGPLSRAMEVAAKMRNGKL